MLSLQQAQDLINKNITTETIKLHIREVGVIMKAVAKELGKNEAEWEIVGLLHDLDYDKEKEHPELQTVTLEKWILEVDPAFPQEYMHAIKAHNQEYSKVMRETALDFALAACDNLSGMIFATALIYPDKKISSVKVSSVLKKMKNPSFAARVNRQSIMDIEKAGIKLERFIEIGIGAMGKIEGELGL
jgi:predicted hydrolase (HD superfamily)